MTNNMKLSIKNRCGKERASGQRGFTLIETLVAVLLLSAAIAGPLTIASKGLRATLVAKDQFIAFYLAQDAIEYVRYVRDSNCIASGGGATGCPVNVWLNGLGAWGGSSWEGGCFSASGCYFDSLNDPGVNPPVVCSTSCPVMNYDDTLKKFTYPPSGIPVPQKFVRTVKITNTVADEAVVTVTVSWSDSAGITHVPVTVRENIFRWQ